MVMRYFLYGFFLSFSLIANAQTTDDGSVKIGYYQSGIETKNKNFKPWQRELITINVRVNTNEEFSYLVFENTELNDYIIESETVENLSTRDNKNFIKQIRIYIWPLMAGKQSLSLPQVNLILSGTVIKKINIDTLNINVKPLPDYLPPGFPVGKITLESHYNSDSILPFILNPGELANYVLKTRTKGIHPSLVPDYSTYLNNANITRLAASHINVNEIFDHQYSYTNSHDIPVVSLTNGINKFNDFRVLYFDPHSGKINSVNYSPINLLTLNSVFQLFIVLLAACSFYYFLHYLYLLLNRVAIRRRIWKEVYRATDPIELSLALRKLLAGYHLFKNTDVHAVNISLEKWVQTWNDDVLALMIKPLISLQFAKAASDNFTDTKQIIINRLQYLENFIFYMKMPKI